MLGLSGLASGALKRQPLPLLAGMTSRWFKVRASVKKLCEDCYIVKRSGRVYVLCKRDAKVSTRAAARARMPCLVNRPLTVARAPSPHRSRDLPLGAAQATARMIVPRR